MVGHPSRLAYCGIVEGGTHSRLVVETGEVSFRRCSPRWDRDSKRKKRFSWSSYPLGTRDFPPQGLRKGDITPQDRDSTHVVGTKETPNSYSYHPSLFEEELLKDRVSGSLHLSSLKTT